MYIYKGNLLKAKDITIWTDVSGVYSADPRYVYCSIFMYIYTRPKPYFLPPFSDGYSTSCLRYMYMYILCNVYIYTCTHI